ncbi:hypothetical protein cyc_08170 [Cyclospora cayetanensis]|uniref:Uncharacterized protein n=1 Tax=Cyclospora cayetanensis TaxID=88456 RepID=A0A1D3DAL4_9EIME|nr:hypothetical protein cyc_08170 [Cyclospora cayetanensis]
MCAADWSRLHVGLVGEICAFLGDTASLVSFATTPSSIGFAEFLGKIPSSMRALKATPPLGPLLGQALGCSFFWKRLEFFCINAAKRRTRSALLRRDANKWGSCCLLKEHEEASRAECWQQSREPAHADQKTQAMKTPPTWGPAPETTLLQPLELLRLLPQLQRLSLQVPSQAPELAGFLGLFCPFLREVELTTRRGFTNAEMQQLCQQMPQLETLDIRIRTRRVPHTNDSTGESVARHSVFRRPEGGPQRRPPTGEEASARTPNLKGIKRYLKLWTEVKRIAVSYDNTTANLEAPDGGPSAVVYARKCTQETERTPLSEVTCRSASYQGARGPEVSLSPV